MVNFHGLRRTSRPILLLVLTLLAPRFCRAACAWLAWAAAIFLYSEIGYAADAPRWVSRAWTVDNGLPHNMVNRVVQDSRGYLWLATGAGLTRFDGISFSLYSQPHRSAVAIANIRDLVARPDGSLLMVPATGGVMEWKNGVFSRHPVSDAVADRAVLEIFAEPSGVIWLGLAGPQVLRWENGHVQEFGEAEGILRRVNRVSFAVDHRGQTWVAGGDFVGCYVGGRLSRPPPALEGIGRAPVIAPTRSGGVWISSQDQLLKLEDDRISICARSDWPARRSGIECLFEDSRGNLWIGTRRHGLYFYSGGKITHVESELRAIFSISEDSEGNLWVGAGEQGLFRYRPLAFTLLDAEAGLPEDLSASVCEDSSGSIWCANRAGGLARWRNGVTQLVGAGTRIGRYVARVAPDAQGNIWAASDVLLCRISAAQTDQIETVEPGLRSVTILFGAANGDMWVQSSAGLGFFHDRTYNAVNDGAAAFTRRVGALAEDARGSVWVATNDTRAFDSDVRLWEYADGKMVERISADQWTAGAIQAMQFDHLGGLWVATSSGLVLKSGDRIRRFTTEDGLPDDVLAQLLIDDLGYIWCGGRRGFFRVASTDLRALAEGRAHKVVATVFGVDDGLGAASALSAGQPRSWKARDGRLWFTSIKGTIGFDPAAADSVVAAPRVYIDGVQLGDHKIPEPFPATLQVPAGGRRLAFHFAAINYSAPEQVRLKHRLEGYDDDWVETPADHIATYSRLAPGRYRLRVIAANKGGVWNEEGATLAMSVAAAWWQTKTFFGLVGLAIAALVAWVARTIALRKISARLRELEREHALERERSRIARNLHDELGGSLTQIGLLADRLKRQGATGELQRTLGQLAWRTRSLAGELESIVWTVSPQNNSWDRLASFIAQFARRFFKDTGISCVVEGQESIPARPLGPDEQHEVLALLKESVNNVLKHSHATEVTIAMQLKDDVFELSIRDNGVGFEPSAAEHSERNGLSNIRARGEALRGEAMVESRAGQGATVRLRVPVAKASLPAAV